MKKDLRRLFVSNSINFTLLVILTISNFFMGDKTVWTTITVILAILLVINAIYMIRLTVKIRKTKE